MGLINTSAKHLNGKVRFTFYNKEPLFIQQKQQTTSLAAARYAHQSSPPSQGPPNGPGPADVGTEQPHVNAGFGISSAGGSPVQWDPIPSQSTTVIKNIGQKVNGVGVLGTPFAADKSSRKVDTATTATIATLFLEETQNTKSKTNEAATAMVGASARAIRSRATAATSTNKNGALPTTRESEVEQSQDRAADKGTTYHTISTLPGGGRPHDHALLPTTIGWGGSGSVPVKEWKAQHNELGEGEWTPPALSDSHTDGERAPHMVPRGSLTDATTGEVNSLSSGQAGTLRDKCLDEDVQAERGMRFETIRQGL